jgi:hypothetical protein
MENLKEKLKKEILETNWEPLAPHFARGAIYLADQDLILEEVGEAMAHDDVSMIKKWLDHGLLYPPTQEQVSKFTQSSEMLFSMLIIEPYVLIQERLN